MFLTGNLANPSTGRLKVRGRRGNVTAAERSVAMERVEAEAHLAQSVVVEPLHTASP